jgi:hypothetical protein
MWFNSLLGIAAALADQHQHFGCSLPFRRLLFGLGQFYDVVCGIAQRDERLAVRQYDRIEERLIPRHDLGKPRLCIGFIL